MVKFTVKTEDLKATLKKAKGTLSCNDQRVILKNFAIKADEANQRLSVVSTDLDLSMISECDCIVPEGCGGAITIPGDQFMGIVDRAGSLDLELQADDYSSALIKSGRFEARLSCLSPEDYPAVRDFKEAESHQTVDREKFLDSINRISFSICDNEARRMLLNVKIDKGEVFASDGKVTTASQLDYASEFTDVMIPSLAVRDLVRVLRASDASALEVAKLDSFLMFKLGSDVFTARMSATQFPDIRKRGLIPTEKNDLQFTCSRQDLRDAVRRVACTSSERSKAVTFSIEGDILTLSAYDRSGNSSKEQVDTKLGKKQADGNVTPFDQKVSILFDYVYVEDVLGAMREDEVTFKFHENIKVPVRIEEPNFIVLMMRLSDTVLKQEEEEEADTKRQPSEGEVPDEV